MKQVRSHVRLRSGLLPSFALGAAALLCASGLRAEQANVKVTGVDTDQDTSIVIKKGPVSSLTDPREFEIVSGEQDVEGDPAASSIDARASWKAACNDWKKEFRDLNKDNQILAFSCNSPSSTLLDNGQRQMKSTGSYKLKVRIRSTPVGRIPSK